MSLDCVGEVIKTENPFDEGGFYGEGFVLRLKASDDELSRFLLTPINLLNFEVSRVRSSGPVLCRLS